MAGLPVPTAPAAAVPAGLAARRLPMIRRRSPAGDAALGAEDSDRRTTRGTC